MAWPTEAAAILSQSHAALNAGGNIASSVVLPAPWRGKYYWDARGKHRIFNANVYRFYSSSTAPPEPGDTPIDTNASLPHTPTDTYGNGTHYFSLSYFNGVIDSGFLAIGPNGETYYRLDVSGGAEIGSPPQKPNDVRLVLKASGVVRVVGAYFRLGSERANEWALAYTFDGSAPATDTPDYTKAMTSGAGQIFDYDLAAQAHGTTVKVRLQTRRNDGTSGSPVWRYSETDADDILTATADAQGPSAPDAGESWNGGIPT